MAFFANPTLIVGAGPVAAALTRRLGAEGRAYRRLDPGGLTRRLVERAETLILADPDDPAEALAEVFDLSAARPARQPALRLVLAHGGTWPADLPQVPEVGRVRLEGFALEAQAARALLAAHPLHAGFDPRGDQAPHLLIAGTAPPALALLGQAIRLAHYGEARPVFTLAVEAPQDWQAQVRAAYPQAHQACTLNFVALATPDLGPAPPITGAWVCLDPQVGLDAAGHLAERVLAVQGVAPPVYLEVGDAIPAGDLEDWDGQTVPVSWRAAAAAALLATGGDHLAQVIHDHYRDTTEAQGRDPALEPAGQPWDRLDGSYRDASCQQAAHLWAKLAATDCRPIPLAEAPAFAFAPLEVERLAQVEHRRWAADRYLNGWTYAPTRDNALRHHPQLIPFADLSEAMKDLDRYVVRLVPTLLARSGLALVRGLILGLGPSPLNTGRAVRRLAEACLRRLAERFPDRGLVVATTLGDPFARLVAALALDHFDAALWLLCPEPLPDLLAAQPGATARRDLLGLVARAERRIALTGPEGLDAWLRTRAQVLLLPGAAQAPAAPARQVRLDPAGAGLSWGFDY